MKKLKKLEINSEKLMKNAELLALRGGYSGPCTCLCWDKTTYVNHGYLVSETGNCPSDCDDVWPNSTGSCQCG
jgi:hypothetical protein